MALGDKASAWPILMARRSSFNQEHQTITTEERSRCRPRSISPACGLCLSENSISSAKLREEAAFI